MRNFIDIIGLDTIISGDNSVRLNETTHPYSHVGTINEKIMDRRIIVPPRVLVGLFDAAHLFDKIVEIVQGSTLLNNHVNVDKISAYVIERALSAIALESVDGELRLYRGMDVPSDWDGTGSVGTSWTTSELYCMSHKGVESNHAIITADVSLTSINWPLTTAYWLSPIEDDVFVNPGAVLSVEHIRIKREGRTVDLIVAPHEANA